MHVMHVLGSGRSGRGRAGADRYADGSWPAVRSQRSSALFATSGESVDKTSEKRQGWLFSILIKFWMTHSACTT